jgi:redox-sensitive bicupin YhaK (pirin superfamily)
MSGSIIKNKEMKKIIHKAADRGFNNLGWLKSYHSFSFGQFYDPNKMNFGLLRVLNDDFVEQAMGFGTHGHDNMEIVSIPLSGSLKHKDSMGNDAVIRTGDVQIMSAGTGIKHSEYNESAEEPVKFLQIWVFPKEHDIVPRYDQKTFSEEEKLNKFLTVVSPDKNNEEAIWINQDAWFSLSNLQAGKEIEYKLNKEGNGVYIFLLEGVIAVADEILRTRDAIGLYETSSFKIEANNDAKILVIEVPMN